MIRRFLSVAVFFMTISFASFGQDIFGRTDLIAWSHVIQEKGPQRIHTAWTKTDQALARLATQAGQGTSHLCIPDDLPWLIKTHQINAQIPIESMPWYLSQQS